MIASERQQRSGPSRKSLLLRQARAALRPLPIEDRARRTPDGHRRRRAGRGAPAAWLYGIAQFTVASRLRRAGRERRATVRVRGRELPDRDDITRIDERLAAEAQSRRLYAAMDRLGAGERAVLELIALDELTSAGVAVALGRRPPRCEKPRSPSSSQKRRALDLHE